MAFFERSLRVFRNMHRPRVLASEIETWRWKQALGFAGAVHVFQVLVILLAVQLLGVDPAAFSKSFAEVDGMGALMLALLAGVAVQLLALWPLFSLVVWAVARILRGNGPYVRALVVVCVAASVFSVSIVFQTLFFATDFALFSVLYALAGGFYLWVLGATAVHAFRTVPTLGLGVAAAFAFLNTASILMSELILRPNMASRLGLPESVQDRFNGVAELALHDGLSEEARVALQMLKIMEHTCSQKDAESCTQLGLLYHSGEPALRIEASNDRGVEFLQKGCEFGGGQACFALASFAASGGLGGDAMAQIPDFLERACQLGEKDACGYLDRAPSSE